MFLAGGGEAGALMRRLDWAATPLGSPEGWPAPLKTLVGVMLASHQPMLIVWGDAHTTLYNDGYAAMCGARHPRAMGRSFAELWHDIWDRVEPILSAAYAGEATQMDDIAFVMHRNGFPEETHFSFGYTPVRAEDGTVAGMFCACAETTAAVKSGRQTAAERERLHRLFEQSPSFVAVLEGPDHVFAFANPGYRQLVAHRDVVGRPVREALPEVAGQGFFELLDEVFRTGQGYSAHTAPLTILREPGGAPEQRYLDFVYQPMRDAVGAITGVFVEGSDVTERVKGNAALAESETRFRAMADDAPVMMWVTDAAGACLYLNRRWYEFTGQEEAQALGLGWLDAVHPDDRGWSGETFLAANARREGFRLEYRLRHTEGGYRWAIDSASPRFSADGTFLGYVGSVVDIEERRDAELALAESEERVRLAAENAEIGLWDFDPSPPPCSGRRGSRRCSASRPTCRSRWTTSMPASTRRTGRPRAPPSPPPSIPPGAPSTTSSTARSAGRTGSCAGSPPRAAACSRATGACACSAPRSTSPTARAPRPASSRPRAGSTPCSTTRRRPSS